MVLINLCHDDLVPSSLASDFDTRWIFSLLTWKALVMSDSRELTIAVCLFPDLTALDYQGPVELFGFLKQENIISRRFPTVPKYTLRITYLSHTLDPVPSSPGPDAVPQETYRNTISNNNQFDIILVPGGSSNPPSLSISRPNCNLTL